MPHKRPFIAGHNRKRASCVAMDGYLYNLDPYRQASAGYYAHRYTSSYGLERRSSYGLPASDSFARVPIDPYAGYGALPSYQPDRSSYASPPTSRHRPRTGPAQNLGPKKKPFKQTQKVRFSEEKGRPAKKALQKKPSQSRVEKPDAKAGKAPKSQTASLAKETQELHSLYRTGVDPNTGDGEGKKRKAETAAGSVKKKKKKKNKFGKSKKKPEDYLPVVERRSTLTEEEKKEAELALELQRGLCESVCQFLGFPPVLEKPETKEVAPVSESDGKPEDTKETVKPKEPERTPEEESEADEKSFAFFSNLFEENQDLCKLYVDKCISGSFECLVCYSTDVETSKQYWNLVSLVVHSNMTSQKRPEHRGYARAVSAVLGWDPLKIPKVPRIVYPTSADKPTGQVKEKKKPETDGKTVDVEEKVADVAATEEHQEEKAAEASSKESIEE